MTDRLMPQLHVSSLIAAILIISAAQHCEAAPGEAGMWSVVSRQQQSSLSSVKLQWSQLPG